MRTAVVPVLALALIVGACGDATTSPTGSAEVAVTTTIPAAEGGAGTTTAPAATTAPAPATAAPMTTAPVPGGPVAPDFTLALGTGGQFSLRAETRPVFLVFWAEW